MYVVNRCKKPITYFWWIFKKKTDIVVAKKRMKTNFRYEVKFQLENIIIPLIILGYLIGSDILGKANSQEHIQLENQLRIYHIRSAKNK